MFVWAGTSGLGSAAVEIAKLAGATVITSAGSDEKLAVLRRTRRRRQSSTITSPTSSIACSSAPSGEGATIVFEHVGQATWKRSLELCAHGGTIVSAGATSGDDAHMNVTYMFAKQVRILGSRLGTMDDALAAARHLSAGRFRPLLGSVLPLDQVAEAHRLMEEGRVIGKVI